MFVSFGPFVASFDRTAWEVTGSGIRERWGGVKQGVGWTQNPGQTNSWQ